jgi:hypothetical protein
LKGGVEEILVFAIVSNPTVGGVSLQCCIVTFFFVVGFTGVGIQAGALPLEPHLQPFISLVILEIVSCFLPRLG